LSVVTAVVFFIFEGDFGASEGLLAGLPPYGVFEVDA
jgi:hypothetical protein